MKRSVTLRGMTARYSPSEIRLMRPLPKREQVFLHIAKSLFDGRLR